MTHRLVDRMSGPDADVLQVEDLETHKRWVLIASAGGLDVIVTPEGRLLDGFTVDSREDTESGRLVAWVGDQEW